MLLRKLDRLNQERRVATIDVMNNVNDFLNLYQQMRTNPAQILSRRFNVPQNVCNDPNAILQHLLDSGQVSQDQVNRAMGMRNNPLIKQIFNLR